MYYKVVKLIVLACSILIVVLNAYKPSFARSLSLRNSLIMAQNQDLELKKLKFDRKVFHITKKEAVKDFYPRITSKFSKSNSFSFSNQRGATIFTFQNSLELPIYDRAIIYNNYKAKSQLILNRIRIKKRLNDLYKEISTLYYTILGLENIAKIRKKEYDKALKIYKLTKARFKLKKAVQLDVLLSEGLLIQTKNNIISANNDLYRKKLELLHKLNINNDISLLDSNNITISENISFEKLLRESVRGHWKIKEKHYEAKIAKELYEIERSVFYPKISLFADVKSLGHDKMDFTSNEWSVFLTFSMALLDDVKVDSELGIRNNPNVNSVNVEGSVALKIFDRKSNNKVVREQYKSLYQKTMAEVRNIKFKIKDQLLEAYHKLIEAKNKVKLSMLNVEIAKGLFKKADVEYSLGKKGMEDVIEAKEKEIYYKIEYQQSTLKLRLNILNLKWASGSLWKELL